MSGLFHWMLDIDLEMVAILFIGSVVVAWALMVVFWPDKIDQWLG